MSDVAWLAHRFVNAYNASGNPEVPEWAQVLNVVGEAGEFAEAYRRYTGHARRSGDIFETAEELADVVISSYVAAHRLGVDLDAAIADKGETIMTRGFKDA